MARAADGDLADVRSAVVIVAVVAVVATVPLFGGRLSKLADLRLRWGGLRPWRSPRGSC